MESLSNFIKSKDLKEFDTVILKLESYFKENNLPINKRDEYFDFYQESNKEEYGILEHKIASIPFSESNFKKLNEMLTVKADKQIEKNIFVFNECLIHFVESIRNETIDVLITDGFEPKKLNESNNEKELDFLEENCIAIEKYYNNQNTFLNNDSESYINHLCKLIGDGVTFIKVSNKDVPKEAIQHSDVKHQIHYPLYRNTNDVVDEGLFILGFAKEIIKYLKNNKLFETYKLKLMLVNYSGQDHVHILVVNNTTKQKVFTSLVMVGNHYKSYKQSHVMYYANVDEFDFIDNLKKSTTIFE